MLSRHTNFLSVLQIILLLFKKLSGTKDIWSVCDRSKKHAESSFGGFICVEIFCGGLSRKPKNFTLPG
jgi:hypothetical protein